MNDKLCVVMPVYNEREAIGGVLEKWARALDALGVDYAIRPYNDGSKDDSLAVMREAAKKLPRVEVRDKPNGGHGNTILTGYRDAAADGFDWVFQIDSDDEMGPEKFGELWAKRADYDFLVGIRDGRVQQLPRKIISFVSRLCVRLFYGKSVWDVNTPYRLMRISSFAPFFSAIPLMTFAPNVILSGLAARHQLRSYEIRVPQHDRTTGEVSIKKWKLLKAAARSFWQTIAFALTFRTLLFACLGSVVLKIILSVLLGPVSDTRNFATVADVVLSGEWPWQSGCYNYGLIWAGIEVLLKSCFGNGLHVAVSIVVGIADVLIAILLWKSEKRIASVLFVLAPAGIVISGVHRMFDNLAIAIAFASVVIFELSRQRRKGRILVSALLLGVSISLKHVCLFFPFWMFWREKTCRGRIILLTVPFAVFALGFAIPICQEVFWGKGLFSSLAAVHEMLEVNMDFGGWISDNFPVTASINNMVFNYYSYGHSYFWEYLAPSFCQEVLPPKLWFIIMMLSLSVLGRKLSALNLFALYLLALFAFSPGYHSYYWAIPLCVFSCCKFGWYVTYNVLTLLVVWYRLPGFLDYTLSFQCPQSIGSISQVLSVGLVFLLLMNYLISIVDPKGHPLPFAGWRTDANRNDIA